MDKRAKRARYLVWVVLGLAVVGGLFFLINPLLTTQAIPKGEFAKLVSEMERASSVIDVIKLDRAADNTKLLVLYIYDVSQPNKRWSEKEAEGFWRAMLVLLQYSKDNGLGFSVTLFKSVEGRSPDGKNYSVFVSTVTAGCNAKNLVDADLTKGGLEVFNQHCFALPVSGLIAPDVPTPYIGRN